MFWLVSLREGAAMYCHDLKRNIVSLGYSTSKEDIYENVL